jgi:hypothetical protein
LFLYVWNNVGRFRPRLSVFVLKKILFQSILNFFLSRNMNYEVNQPSFKGDNDRFNLLAMFIFEYTNSLNSGVNSTWLLRANEAAP